MMIWVGDLSPCTFGINNLTANSLQDASEFPYISTKWPKSALQMYLDLETEILHIEEEFRNMTLEKSKWTLQVPCKLPDF